MGNKRIALNTIFTVGQSLLATACGLFTGRWVLNALGHDGFGVFSVVGGLMVFVLFLNGVLTNSACRHFAYAIGEVRDAPLEKRYYHLGHWFTASLYVHAILSVVLCGVGYFVGEWYIASKLVVAESMRGECFWVFRFSLIAAFFSIVSAPYFALYTAKQLIFVRTIFSFGSMVFNAFGAYALFFFASDRIFWHALIIMAIQVVTTVMIVLLAMVKFPETRRFGAGTKLCYIRELFTFGGAQMLGMFANMLRAQGVALVVNRFSGLSVNAGMGLGNQVTSRSAVFATSAMSAILPEITTCLASSDKSRAFSIANKVDVFVTMSYAFLLFPIISNINYILHLWLGNPPETAAAFCAISLFVLYFDALTGGDQQLINANGKIFLYQLLVGITISSSIVIALVLYMMGCSAVVSVGVATIGPTTLLSVVRLAFMKKLFGIGPVLWLRGCLIPNVIMLLASCIASYGISYLMGPGLLAFFVISLANFIVVVLVGCVVLTPDDRRFMLNKISVVLHLKRSV